MKKSAILSLALILSMCLSWAPLPAAATEPTETVDPTETTAPPMTIPAETGEAPQTDLAFGSVCVLNGCRTLDGMVPLAGSERKANTAASVVIYERQTKTMIYSYNPDMKISPGSLAKLVTALVVIESMPNLKEVVTVPKGVASRLPGGAHTIKLKSEEKLTVEDLLHCMILQNAADAALALAETISGNQRAFVDLMNARVKAMGCTSTEFGNVHGFDNVSHYTTARDMARFMLEATKNEIFADLIACQEYTVPENELAEARKFQSQNYLMEPKIVPKYNNKYVTGGMAAYSDTAGASVVCTANTSTEKKQGLDLVCVLMGATREFNPEQTWRVLTYGNFEEMLDMLNYTFESFKVSRVIYTGQSLEQYPVAGGESEVVGEPRVELDSVLPKEVQMTNLIRNRHINNGGLTAPIAKDSMIGTIELWYRNSCVLEAELYAQNSVRLLDQSGLTIRNGLSKKQSENNTAAKIVWIGCAIVLVPVVSYLVINSIMRNRMRARHRRRRHGRRRSG